MLINKLVNDFPEVKFEPGQLFCWSPKERVVIYKSTKDDKVFDWSLLHELSHAVMSHESYQSDLELLMKEVEAWEKAKKLAEAYSVEISEDHIQDCIDTYRDWLYQRSSCPNCSCTGLQKNSVTYECFNCKTTWTVTASRFCRPYRLSRLPSKQQKSLSIATKSLETTFL